MSRHDRAIKRCRKCAALRKVVGCATNVANVVLSGPKRAITRGVRTLVGRGISLGRRVRVLGKYVLRVSRRICRWGNDSVGRCACVCREGKEGEGSNGIVNATSCLEGRSV